jgi:integrase
MGETKTEWTGHSVNPVKAPETCLTFGSEKMDNRAKQLQLELVQILLRSSVPRRQEVRIRARGVCPKCKRPFTQIGKLGFICLDHETVPKRYFLDFWRKITVPGQKKPTKSVRTAIYSTKDGKVLETFSEASDLTSVVEEELRNKTFDPEKYARQKQSVFRCSYLLSKFLEEKKRTIAPSYIGHYERYVKILSDYFRDMDVREIAAKKIHLKNLISHLEEAYVVPGKWKAKTMKNCAEKMRHFLNWVHDDLELIPSVPAFPEIVTEEPTHRWVHSKDQLKIFEGIGDLDKPIIGFMMLHGCRPGEARALKCKDVDIEGQVIIFHATFSKEEYRLRRKGKKAKPLYVPIHPEALEYLKSRKAEALAEAWVFPNPRTGNHYTASAITRIWKRLRKNLKVPGLRLYDATRHSFASNLVAQGVSIYKVKDLLGHTSVKTTEKNYAHADLDALRMAIGKVTLKIASIKSVSETSVSDPLLAEIGFEKHE